MMLNLVDCQKYGVREITLKYFQPRRSFMVKDAEHWRIERIRGRLSSGRLQILYTHDKKSHFEPRMTEISDFKV